MNIFLAIYISITITWFIYYAMEIYFYEGSMNKYKAYKIMLWPITLGLMCIFGGSVLLMVTARYVHDGTNKYIKKLL